MTRPAQPDATRSLHYGQRPGQLRHPRAFRRNFPALALSVLQRLLQVLVAASDAGSMALAALSTRLRSALDTVRLHQAAAARRARRSRSAAPGWAVRSGAGRTGAVDGPGAGGSGDDWRQAFDAAPVGMARVNLEGRFGEVNRSFAALLGRSAAELSGKRLSSIVHPDDLEALGDEGHPAKVRGVARVEVRVVRGDGRVRCCELSSVLVRDEDGSPQHVLVHLLDVTDRKRSEAALRHLASRDPLTGLRNRRSFHAELERHVRHGLAAGHDGALLMIDLDHFKAVNDTLGHQAGDALLVGVAERLAGHLRETDVLARLGGDEFGVIVRHGDRRTAEVVARKLVAAVAEEAASVWADGRSLGGQIVLDRQPVPVSASVGVVLFDGRAGAELLASADSAMYDAKRAGRNGYTVAECALPVPGYAAPVL